MTVAEFIELLKKQPQDAIVITVGGPCDDPKTVLGIYNTYVKIDHFGLAESTSKEPREGYYPAVEI